MEGIQDLTVTTKGGDLLVRLMELENGLSVFISTSKRPRLGLIALSTPPVSGHTEPSSSSLFGANPESALVRTIAERITQWTGQSCLIVVAVKPLDRELVMEILRSLKNHLLS